VIHSERIKNLNKGRLDRGRYVLYWMQASQRVEYNHALEFGILKANELNLPIVVFFGISDDFPDANERHYHFMLEGLKSVQSSLKGRGIKMVVRHQSPERGAVELARDASLVLVDRGYLRIQKAWRQHVAERIRCPLIQVEADVVVPVEVASRKEEYAAATIRSKIATALDRYLVPLKNRRVRKDSLGFRLESFDIEDAGYAISQLRIDNSAGKVSIFRGGTPEAKKHLVRFLRHRLDGFAELRNDPTVDYLSNMSPYLHFGQISPLYIALKVKEARSMGTAAYLEELIVRRELSMNFVHYNPNYDTFRALPEWARKTLGEHRQDRREHVYTLKELEQAATHDPYWNAAQTEMMLTGKMHGYMRMYWGKKILEWTRTPEYAFKTALYLNNKYELDGRDPNGFTGVAWCFGKHDRPWGERKVFGKVRYMNDKGLRRKFNADAYLEKIAKLAEKEQRSQKLQEGNGR
jgi:deoxyribodipyrimidine photo-lyase